MRTLRPQPGVVGRHLARLPAFRDLSADDLAGLEAHALLRSYEKGELLFRTGEQPQALHCLVAGSLRIVRRAADGREKVIHLHTAPVLVAEAPSLLGQPYPADAELQEDALVVSIPRTELAALSKERPELAWRIIAHLFERLRELTRSVAAHTHQSAGERVAAYLLGRADDEGVVSLPAAKKDIASFLGIRPESFSRTLAALQKEGIISVDEQVIRICDTDALRTMLPGVGERA